MDTMEKEAAEQEAEQEAALERERRRWREAEQAAAATSSPQVRGPALRVCTAPPAPASAAHLRGGGVMLPISC
jgi:hypothetical protein